jgi:DNA invertase Pin-like site-specific DNA recombinase
VLRVSRIERYPDTATQSGTVGSRQVTASGNNVGKTTSPNQVRLAVCATVRVMPATPAHQRGRVPARAAPARVRVMAKIGYARLSTRGQNDDSQVDDLTAYGCDKIFIDTASGKLAARPELDRALANLREGDVFVITRLSRAMRSLKHLLALADELRDRGAGLVVLKQHIDTTTPTGRLVFHILGAIDEFQRELIIEGTREGLQAARARGRTGGRKPKLNARQSATVRRMYEAAGPDGKRQHTVAKIAEAVGVHRTTVYDYLNRER